MTNELKIKIQENFKFPNALLNMRLADMYCKHMVKSNYCKDSKANKLLAASCKLDYPACEWGFHLSHASDIVYHINLIERMEGDGYNPIIRIVICKYDFCNKSIVWVDNLHSSIKYIRQYGEDVKLRDIPFYVVDITNFDNPVISGYFDNLRKSYKDILGAVSCAYKRFERSNLKELIDVHYTVGDLLKDNPALCDKH